MPTSDQEIARALASSDPATTGIDAPLSLRAEEDLARILRHEHEHRPAGQTISGRKRSADRRRWIGLGAIALALAGVFFITQSVGPARVSDGRVQAATPALLRGQGSLPGWSDAVTAARASVAASTPTASTRGSSYSAWFLNTDVGASGKGTLSYVSPQDVTLTWNPDLSGRLSIVAGTPLARLASGVADNAHAPKPGSVLSDESHTAGGLGVIFAGEPPTTAKLMARYLAESAGTADRVDPVQVIDSVQLLMDEWRLGTESQRALLEVLGDLPGVAPMGTVTDRLGRPGAGFVATSETDPRFEDVIVIDVTAGVVLSVEKVFLGGAAPEYSDLKPPVVTSYVAWKQAP